MSSPLPPPRPPRRRRRNNHIDERQAEKFGSFLDMARQEIEDVNTHARERALSEGHSEYYRCGSAHIQYTMKIKVGREVDGVDKQREAEVVMDTDLEKVSNSSVDQAPFNVLKGVISPAEKNRDEVIYAVEDAMAIGDLPLGRHLPIFSLGGKGFWVVDPDRMTHYVVELSPTKVTQVTDLSELNELTREMFLFLQSQLTKTYGG